MAIEVPARPGDAAFGARVGWRDPWSAESEQWRSSPWVALPLPGAWLLLGAERGLRWRIEWDPSRGSRRWSVVGRHIRWTLHRRWLEALRRLALPGDSLSVHLPTTNLPPGLRLRLQDARSAPWLDVPLPKGTQRIDIPLVPPEGRIFLELPGRRRTQPVALPAHGAEHRTVRLPPLPKGGKLLLHVSGPDGSPLTARVRIVATKDAPPPHLGPDWLAAGAGEALVAEHGEALVRLPAGRYRVQVTYGSTWSRAVFETRLDDDVIVERRVVLAPEVDEGPWVSADLHVHAAPSPDSRVALADRLRTLRAEGIRFAVATDHNRVTDYAEALEAQSPRLRTVPGVEVTTWNPAFGHFNVYPVPYDPRLPDGGAPPYQRLDPSRLFGMLRARYPEALIQVCHPRLEPDIGYFDLFGYRPRTGRAARKGFRLSFDVLEVFNGYDLARPERVEQVLRDWMSLLARGHRVTGVGSSDSHTVRFHWAGYPRTWVRLPDATAAPPRPEAFFEALRKGHAVVSSGPLILLSLRRADTQARDASAPPHAEGSAGPGDTIPLPRGAVRATVRLLAPSWMPLRGELTLWSARGVLLRRASSPSPETGPDGERLRVEENLHLRASDHFVLATFRGTEPLDAFFGREGVFPMAFTNPVWLQ